MHLGLNGFHFFSGQANSLAVGIGNQFHVWVIAFPGHRFHKMKCGFDLIENFTSPVVLQDAPATFDGIVLAVIGRVVSQANGDLPLLGKSNYAFQNWVRRLLFSGPLSWLITNVLTFGNRGRTFCHHRSNTSTMKSLVMLEAVK